MASRSIFSTLTPLLAGGALALTVATSAHAATPKNMGLGLRELATAYQDRLSTANAGKAGVKTKLSHKQAQGVLASFDHAQVDEADRILVDIYLDGSTSVDEAVKACEALGCEISARVDWYRNGLLSAWVPLELTKKLARAAGVNVVNLAAKPFFHASATGTGVTAAQSNVVHKTKALNALGYDGSTTGTGFLTVGALSDSYNRLSNQYPVKAPAGVTAGDLPGTTNPDGYLAPVSILQEANAIIGGEDEGRAMLEIIHDLAPAAHLAFATAGTSQATFANNILGLGAPVGTTTSAGKAGQGCNVICDDVGFAAEPMFSDGVIAQAIDTVTAAGISYFSSEGNDGNHGYAATYTPVTNDANAQALLTAQGVPYSGIAATETAVIESYHSFGKDATGKDILVQNVTVTGSTAAMLVFQWNDPFSLVTSGVNQVTTDYDILVFNGTTGAPLTGRSGTAVNGTTNQPIEQPGTTLAINTPYKIVLVRTSRPVGAGITRNQADQIRYVSLTNDGPITGDFITPSNVEAYGHNNAAGCNGCAAYVYDIAPNPSEANHVYTPGIEGFSSNGPSKIYFDKAGNRLASPVTRKQPTLAACDGVNTSFFPPATATVAPSPTNPSPNDYDGDGYPNFFGTSAAAPNAAGVATVLLSTAAKNGIALSPADVRSLLTTTTQGTIDQDPDFISATTANGAVTFSGTGDTATDPNTFTVAFNGTTGQTLTTLVFNVTGTGVHFDSDVTTGFPFTVGKTTGPTTPTLVSSVVTAGTGGFNTVATLTFSNFVPGDTLNFGVDRDNDTSNAYGNGVDQLQGATFTATVTNADSSTTNALATLANKFSRKWNYKAGYGLIDAQAAVNRLLGQ